MKGMKELEQRMAEDLEFRAQMTALARQQLPIEQVAEAIRALGYDVSANDLTGCGSCRGCER